MSSTAADFAARPHSESEWETLLVRYEIGPWTLRIAVEETKRGTVTRDLGFGFLLYPLVHNEYWIGVQFGAMLAGKPARYSSVPQYDQIPGDPFLLLNWVAKLRAHNLATVRRYGPAVWDWRADSDSDAQGTVHQIIQHAVAVDCETLAVIRGALKDAEV